MAVAFSIATMATVRLPMSPRRLVSLPRVGLPAPSGLTMIMMADSTFLCAASSTLTNPKTSSAATPRRATAITAFLVFTIPRRAGSFTTMATGPSRKSDTCRTSGSPWARHGASWRQTLITTAGWICGWPTIGIVGHPQIHPAVVINVCRHDAPCLAHGLPDVRQVSDFREGPVAIVVKEPARRGIVNTRNAVIAVARLGVAAELVFGFVKVDEAAHKKVESAIIIIVKPDGAGSPTRGSDTSLRGDIGKRTVAIVAIENATAILCQVKDGEAVAARIPNCHTHPVSARCNARLPRNVCECAVPVVVIESVAKRRLRVIEVATTAVDQVDVHPAVVVVIEEGTAGSSSFRQKHLRRAPVTVHPSDPTDRWRNLFELLRRSRTCTPLRVPKIRPYEDVCGAGE